jgi:8-oxo-dGTP diphosphatase
VTDGVGGNSSLRTLMVEAEDSRRTVAVVPVRVTFHEQHEADSLVQTLTLAGYDAGVSRERFAGDDDDEAVAHVVHTDAPADEVEELLGDSDAFVEESSPLTEAPPDPGADLPSSPIQRKS